MSIRKSVRNLVANRALLRDAMVTGNLRVARSLLGPAYRGLIAQDGKGVGSLDIPVAYGASLDLSYKRAHPAYARLYEAATSYASLGLLEYEGDRAAPELTVNDLLAEA